MKFIKKVWFSPYKLTERQSRSNHYGILLKVLFSKGEEGYTSLHPLSSFGEGELSDYLQLLKNCNEFHALPYNTSKRIYYRGEAAFSLKVQIQYLTLNLQFAWMDAQARVQRRSLLFGFPPIENYRFVSSIHEVLKDALSHTFKMKLGENLNQETYQLKKVIKNHSKKLRLRLDFNERITKKEWIIWEKENLDLLSIIDYIEDPFFNFSIISSRFPLACDWSFAHFCPIRIVKASRHPLTSIYDELAKSRCNRVIFTHSLAHPFEARLSWVKASQFYKVHPGKKEICGLDYPVNFFEKNDFSCFYSSSQFYSPAGTGFGFDELLEKQKWKIIQQQ